MRSFDGLVVKRLASSPSDGVRRGPSFGGKTPFRSNPFCNRYHLIPTGIGYTGGRLTCEEILLTHRRQFGCQRVGVGDLDAVIKKARQRHGAAVLLGHALQTPDDEAQLRTVNFNRVSLHKSTFSALLVGVVTDPPH